MPLKSDGIIFDVDGTLWDATGLIAKAWTTAARENGLRDLSVTPKWLRGEFGKRMDVIADEMLPQLAPEERYRIMDLCCACELETLREDPCRFCYPGVERTMRELSETVPLFIVSNCQAGYIELFLEKTDLQTFVRDTECFGNNGRGKAENLRLLIRRNHLRAPLYVGDTKGDADAAAQAGTAFVFAAYGYGTADQFEAEIFTFPELKKLIGGGCAR